VEYFEGTLFRSPGEASAGALTLPLDTAGVSSCSWRAPQAPQKFSPGVMLAPHSEQSVIC
jgi:hypothetical protein